MYLAEHTINGRKKYILRDSCYDPGSNSWLSRDLFDLGWTPWDLIVYPGGNSFYIDEAVSRSLEVQGVDFDLCELEELFWKFIRKEIREKLEPFHCRGLRARRKQTVMEDAEERDIQIFDRRRMYYLRTGQVDQRRIHSLPSRYFKTLLNKSRDEIEQYIMQLEKNLSPNEYKQYVYVSFDLQQHFASSALRFVPQALDQDELDRCFLKYLCRMHRDQIFWAGIRQEGKLHEYLVRYAVMFFDYEFDGGSAWDEYLNDFINSKRFYRPPSGVTVSMTEVVEIFEVSEQELQAMSRSDLTKLYRQKAHELHPDKGGEHDDFVRLSEAYDQLLQRKS